MKALSSRAESNAAPQTSPLEPSGDPEEMTFGQRLKAMRKARRMTQTDLGRSLGTDGGDVSKQAIGSWELGRHYPNPNQIAAMCARLQCSADWLLTGRNVSNFSVRSADEVVALAFKLENSGDDVRTRLQTLLRAILAFTNRPV